MRTLYFSFLLFSLSICSVLAQQRSVSVIHENQLFNYVITRYSPAWEIQSEIPRVRDEHAKLFKKVEDAQVNNLKSLLYVKGLIPGELKDANGSSFESYLASKRLVMHYRITYKDHVIFVAHLNNSPTRSIIPFKVDRGQWTLDPSFAETAFFHLIAQPFFNIFNGELAGKAYCYLGFEDVEKNGTIYDYSGSGNHARTNSQKIVDGRIGGALRITNDTDLYIDLAKEKELNGDRFSIEAHFNIAPSFLNDSKERILYTVSSRSGQSLEMSVQNDQLVLKTKGSKEIRVPMVSYDSWLHLVVRQVGKKLSMEIDGKEVAATTTVDQDVLDGMFHVGGKNSFRGLIDELRIAK